ncbi:hypothetical protein AB0E62_34240 [Streptomyces sp. NPDC038707]|uniref:hypothetical protein n=1 Tax=Streptomyces sp. NPDC038707 TaxID=3154329 RepID=UPI0033D17B85
MAYDPLHKPENDPLFVLPLEQAIGRAREVLAEKATANIHDRDAMIRAATGLHYVLRDLLAAIDASQGNNRPR